MMAFSNFVALVGIVSFTAIGAVKEGAAQSSTLTAFYTAPVVSMAPMWIAKEAGFFKKQGLDVKLVFIASGPAGTTSILSGERRCRESSADLPRHGQLRAGQRIW